MKNYDIFYILEDGRIKDITKSEWKSDTERGYILQEVSGEDQCELLKKLMGIYGNQPCIVSLRKSDDPNKFYQGTIRTPCGDPLGLAKFSF